MAEASGAGSSQSMDVSPLHLQMVEQGERWVMKKYGRVGRPRDKDRNQAQKRVYESNEESGLITLTILTTGHFFISQGHVLLEGFSLISAKSWLKVGKKLDWLLFGSKIKLNKVRMFRVQFDGDSKDKAQENCDNCFQRLQHFLCDQNESVQESPQSFPEQRITMTEVAQRQYKLIWQIYFFGKRMDDKSHVAVYVQVFLIFCMKFVSSAWENAYKMNICTKVIHVLHLQGIVVSKQANDTTSTYMCPPLNEELCSFLKLCLLDQNFPGFVEAVEKELNKLIKS
ncbi:meiotic recombination protein REC114 [Bufo gargarizans]|uniref:meiotic recombination protein REC114 n=1 Tax=Bufo gargarizans TaxID=30331 RepID=UPI001CF27655|nr:meiotic recombination protein REC114 [Bufo gargarizans]